MKTINAEEILLLSKLIFEVSGLHLDKDKGYLLETRLNPLLASHACATFSHLYSQAKADTSGRLQQEIVEAMTTNETFFFRDNTPFDLMRNKIIPDLIDRRAAIYRGSKIPLRIWSAACSSGQEVYSIAMTLVEMLGGLARYDLFILGTDIADKVIAQASYGKYNQFEMERGLPLHYRNRYFSPQGTDWRIKDEIRSLAQFRTMNLMKPFPDLGAKFDLIFCRNVAIYFNQADKVRLFQKIAKVLQSDGALLVGGSESLTGMAPDFESRNYLKGIFYQLSGQVAAAPRPVQPPLPLAPLPPSKVPGQGTSPLHKVSLPGGETLPPRPAEAGIQKLRPAVAAVAQTPARAPIPALAVNEGRALSSQALPPAGTEPQPASPPTIKKSLLSSLHSNPEQGPALLSGSKKAPDKTSLLEQLAKKKEK